MGRLAFLTAPNISPKNPDGTYNITNTNGVGLGNNLNQTGIYNPVFLLDKNKFNSSSFHLITSLYAEIEIFKFLKFKTTYMLDKNDVESQSYLNPKHGDGFTNQGTANNTSAKLIKTGLTNTLNFQKSIKETHNFTALIGTEQLRSISNGWGGSRQKVADDFFESYQGNFITNNPPVGNFQGENVFLSYFGYLSYDYLKKYFVTASARRDGYSGLAKGNEWGNFWGASAGWSLSEENFYKNSALTKYMNSVKLRTSYGKVGNMGIPDFGSLSLYNSGLYADINTITYAQAGNPTLKWETSTKFDVGLVLGFLKDRIQFEASYFKNNIDGLVLNAPQAPSKGIPNNSILINVGSMYNKGIELAVNSTNIDTKNFVWTSNVNFSFIDNKVTELANGNSDIVGTTSNLERTNITRVGYSVGSIYAVRTDGVNPENGQRIFINAAGKKVQYSHIVPAGKSRWTYVEDGGTAPAITAADAVVVGNALPKWYGGINNTVKFRDLIDLNIGLTFSGGNYVYNGSKAGMRDQRFWNNSTDMMDRWTYTGQSTDIPRVVFGDNVSNGSSFPISENVEKADFLKVRNISLGYTFHQKWFGKTGINSLRLYIQAANILTITKYTGSDPEVSTNGNSNTTPGVDRNSVPQAQTFTFGLNLSL